MEINIKKMKRKKEKKMNRKTEIKTGQQST